MSDGDSAAAAPPSRVDRTRGERLRGFLRGRSGTQRIGALTALAILATAPFGGLAEVEPEPVEPLVLGETVDIGPFDVTLRNVLSVPDLAPAITPRPGRRLLVLDVTVESDTDRAERLGLVLDAWTGTGTGARPAVDGGPIEIQAVSVDDATQVYGSYLVNPGQVVRVALVLEQVAFWDPADLRLELSGYETPEADPFTLDDTAPWGPAGVLREGHVETEVQP